MNDQINLTPIERQLAKSLRNERHTMSPDCLAPEEMLDLIEQGKKHTRHAALQSHLAGCAWCRQEVAVLNQIWHEARNLPDASPVPIRPTDPKSSEAQEPSIAPSPSRPSFMEWLRAVAFGRAGARIAWGLASLVLLSAAWIVWQGHQMRTALLTAQAQLRTEQMRFAALNEQLIRLRKSVPVNGMAPESPDRNLNMGQDDKRALADARIRIHQLQTRLTSVESASQQRAREAQSKEVAANARMLDLKRQFALARNDGVTNRLMLASIADVRPDKDTVRANGYVRLLNPRATCVLEERPLFRWALDNKSLDVTGYEITIDGNNGYHRVKQLPKDANEWDMATEPSSLFPSLNRGAIYRWQLRVLSSGSAPIASAPAKLKIASQELANRIAHARPGNPGQPLSLFKTYLQNGLLDNARREINDMLDNLKSPASTPER